MQCIKYVLLALSSSNFPLRYPSPIPTTSPLRFLLTNAGCSSAHIISALGWAVLRREKLPPEVELLRYIPPPPAAEGFFSSSFSISVEHTPGCPIHLSHYLDGWALEGHGAGGFGKCSRGSSGHFCLFPGKGGAKQASVVNGFCIKIKIQLL